MTTPKRPISFNEAMVQAIIDGRKTQTRRIVKPQPSNEIDNLGDGDSIIDLHLDRVIRCPYGTPGDRLLVVGGDGSLITLEIINVRVERLNDITEDDARAEGWSPADGQGPCEWFEDLWESIYGLGSLDLNPWVWVVEFKVLEMGGGK